VTHFLGLQNLNVLPIRFCRCGCRLELVEISKQQGEQLLTLINRVDRLDGMIQKNSGTVDVINKLFWVVLAAAATAITGMLFIQ